MSIQILMPALSPTMEEGKLSKWLVKEGDMVKSGDILCEIETDKATMEFEAVDEGRIEKLLVPEGTENVKVNAPIAVLVSEGERASAADIPATMTLIKEAVAEVAKPKAVVQVMSAPAKSSSSPLEGEEGAKRLVGGTSQTPPTPLTRVASLRDLPLKAGLSHMVL
jgi:pyruvate/2-oxoglutarate dehydrogenase complex dihydrolipoamide acyltransferase (E2) component